MMSFALKTGKAPAPATPAWAEAQVALAVDRATWLLDDGRLAR